ncbi:hypothetical protein UlMin_022688 [Ulmus minor]
MSENSKQNEAVVQEVDDFEALMDDYEDIGAEIENVVDQEPIDHSTEDEEDQYDDSSPESDDSFNDDPAWRDDVADDSGEFESYGSYVVDSTDEDQELELNLTDEQAIHKGRQRSNSETTEDENDEEGTKKRKRPASRTPLPTTILIYDARGRVQLGLYQCFKDNKHFRECLVSYTVEQGFELRKVKSCRSRVTYRCAAEGCIWRIHASTSPYKLVMMVKTLQDEHLCQAIRNNKNATLTWIARVLGPEFLADPNMRLTNIRKKLKDKFGVTGLSKAKLFRARVKARGGTLESHITKFQKLRWYANMVLRTNPGSISIVRSEVTRLGGLPHFQRISICLEACKRGFLTGCRPVVGLDGCHLKGPYGGVLLAAISVEANMGYFPLAYAIAEIENQETWYWFLEHLKEAVGRDLEMKP